MTTLTAIILVSIFLGALLTYIFFQAKLVKEQKKSSEEYIARLEGRIQGIGGILQKVKKRSTD